MRIPLFKRYDLDSIDNMDTELIDRVVRWFLEPLKSYFKAEVRGLERVPKGAALYVANHNSGFVPVDGFIFGGTLYKEFGIEGVPFGLGHDVIMNFPILHQILAPLGCIRASHENAHRLFINNKKALVYPGGDMETLRPYRDRDRIVFEGRCGYVRLALRENVPIIPVVAAGAHETFFVIDDMRWLAKLLRTDRWLRTEVWPAIISFPWGLTIGPPPLHFPLPTRILIEIMEPILLERSGEDAAEDDAYVHDCAHRIESSMQQTLDRLALERKGSSHCPIN
ncbi:MAG: 1-acyl-sn-glycerol-3-phosphate acyltransferase [Pseudomonadota bacterium]